MKSSGEKQCKKLTLLEDIKNSENTNTLKDCCLIAGQHILGTTVDLIKLFLKLGLDPQKIYLLGKCYSTNQNAFQELRSLGVYVSDDSFFYDSTVEFDAYYPQIVSDFISFAIKDLKQKIGLSDKLVILDDGGFVINSLKEKLKKESLTNFFKIVGVEQTSSGLNKISGSKIPFPVINVARSFSKLEYESPIIARVAHNRLRWAFKELNLSPKKALILGAGYIGNAMFQELSLGLEVSRYDLDEDLSDHKTRDLVDVLNDYDLIVGCTGSTSVPYSIHEYLKSGTILASISSSDREFDAFMLRRQEGASYDCHEHVHTKKGIYLLNGGFPVNFYGGLHSVPPEYIQLTRALLAFGVIQAVKDLDKAVGVINLKKEYQQRVLDKFMSLNLLESEPYGDKSCIQI